MFSDGIRPGSDLTKLDHSWDTNDSSTRTTPTNVYKGSSICMFSSNYNI